jgi:hypothetical protein
MDPNYFLPIDDSVFDPTDQNLRGTVTSLSINQSLGNFFALKKLL